MSENLLKAFNGSRNDEKRRCQSERGAREKAGSIGDFVNAKQGGPDISQHWKKRCKKKRTVRKYRPVKLPEKRIHHSSGQKGEVDRGTS